MYFSWNSYNNGLLGSCSLRKWVPLMLRISSSGDKEKKAPWLITRRRGSWWHITPIHDHRRTWRPSFARECVNGSCSSSIRRDSPQRSMLWLFKEEVNCRPKMWMHSLAWTFDISLAFSSNEIVRSPWFDLLNSHLIYVELQLGQCIVYISVVAAVIAFRGLW